MIGGMYVPLCHPSPGMSCEVSYGKQPSYKTSLGSRGAGVCVRGVVGVGVPSGPGNGAETLTWQIDVINSTGDVGYTPSLALEPGTDDPHISYYDNTLKDLAAFPVSSGGIADLPITGRVIPWPIKTPPTLGCLVRWLNSLGQWGIAYGNSALGVNEFAGFRP